MAALAMRLIHKGSEEGCKKEKPHSLPIEGKAWGLYRRRGGLSKGVEPYALYSEVCIKPTFQPLDLIVELHLFAQCTLLSHSLLQ